MKKTVIIILVTTVMTVAASHIIGLEPIIQEAKWNLPLLDHAI